jgi:hypothetical protein
MVTRPILRPMLCLRAVCRITASLTGKTSPAKSRAILYTGHSLVVMVPVPHDLLSEFTETLRGSADGKPS